jgi:hypothetical protein
MLANGRPTGAPGFHDLRERSVFRRGFLVAFQELLGQYSSNHRHYFNQHAFHAKTTRYSLRAY